MSDLSNYPETHPETGKVKNPLTGNWIEPSYAKKKDLLQQAKKHTQQHFKEENTEEEEEIEELLKEAENADPGEAFDLDDEELERLDERADINHPEVPDSDFPEEESFARDSDGKFQKPPTPEGFENAAKGQKSSGDHKGIYSGTGNRSRQNLQEENQPSSSNFEEKHEEDEVRYERTDAGGMKIVYPNRQNEE